MFHGYAPLWRKDRIGQGGRGGARGFGRIPLILSPFSSPSHHNPAGSDNSRMPRTWGSYPCSPRRVAPSQLAVPRVAQAKDHSPPAAAPQSSQWSSTRPHRRKQIFVDANAVGVLVTIDTSARTPKASVEGQPTPRSPPIAAPFRLSRPASQDLREHRASTGAVFTSAGRTPAAMAHFIHEAFIITRCQIAPPPHEPDGHHRGRPGSLGDA